MTFKPFQYQDLGAKPFADDGSMATYAEPQFDIKQDAKKADAAHRGNNEAFRLDPRVASHLGIAKRQEAEMEAQIRKEIERRWEKMSEKAEVTGYTKGLEEGKNEAIRAEAPRIKERLDRLDQLLTALDGMRALVFNANEGFLMDIVARVAGMVALKEVELDKDYVRRLILELLHQLGSRDDLKIVLAEADLANVHALQTAIEKEFGKLNNTVIEVSEEVPTGGCKIETRFGVVDASVNAQIDNVMKALKAK